MSGMVLLGPLTLGETKTIPFDFVSDLAIGETISSASVAVAVWSGFDASPSSILSGAASISGTKVNQKFTNGQDGTIYQVKVSAVTSTAQTLTLTGYLAVESDELAGNPPGAALPTTNASAGFLMEKAATLINPGLGDEVILLHTDVAVNVTKMMAVMSGGSSPSVTYKVYWGSSLASGTAVVTAGSTCTSTTVGDAVTTFDSASVPASSFMWIEMTAVSGAPTEINITISF